MLAIPDTCCCSWVRSVCDRPVVMAALRGILAWVVLVVTACDAGAPAPQIPEPLAPAAVHRLGPGDVFEAKVFGDERLDGKYQLAEDGTINFPLLGTIDAAGKTQHELAELLEDRLADGYLRDPHVTINIVEQENREVTVLGQVQQPGTFPYRERLTLVQAISLAGGLTPVAQPRKVKLTRQLQGGRRTYEISVADITSGKASDPTLQPGDIVFVPESPI